MTNFRHTPDVLPEEPWAPIPYPAGYIADVLAGVRSIAVVGFSAKPHRPSHEIAIFLQARGFRVIPVNPGLAGQDFLGQRVYGTLSDCPAPVELVNVFRRSDAAAEVVTEAIACKADKHIGAVWLQSGVRSDPAAQAAEAAGLKMVMNRCIRTELTRL